MVLLLDVGVIAVRHAQAALLGNVEEILDYLRVRICARHLEPLQTLGEFVPQEVVPLANDLGDADKVDEGELIMVCKHRVPQSDHILHLELLADK